MIITFLMNLDLSILHVITREFSLSASWDRTISYLFHLEMLHRTLTFSEVLQFDKHFRNHSSCQNWVLDVSKLKTQIWCLYRFDMSWKGKMSPMSIKLWVLWFSNDIFLIWRSKNLKILQKDLLCWEPIWLSMLSAILKLLHVIKIYFVTKYFH